MPFLLPAFAHLSFLKQFYAFEVCPSCFPHISSWNSDNSQIARNRLGLNQKAHEIAKEEAEKERAKAEKDKSKKKGKKAQS
jgi:hypothetical protein